MKIDLQQIKELLGIVSSTDVTEFTIEFGDQRITVKKDRPVLAQTFEIPAQQRQVVHAAAATATAVAEPPRAAAATHAPEAPKADTVASAEDNGTPANTVAITSPMVGTFYGQPSPTAASFVKMGDRISVGQTVCIIEAMKLMNDLPSEVAGKIVKICVENGTTVEYGQTLYLVDPKG
ncbi:MAG: acetyl-CoA carboxylase biotin carboxyl carrier protein [Cyanobacteriota bacterium erpe_2018_sw_21hr_WHONDRS-SW48-000092_B_bin.40]|nr:acetyl-CoA carboxylase biotin carboxyl carrier protein [Cyanobacteriota bacterium erpe_2018_sw_21hr_WHONDRS-SW48-000092_B_bin.40]